MVTARRFLGVGVALGLAAGLLAGAALWGPGQAAATGTSPSAAPSHVSVGAMETAPTPLSVGADVPAVTVTGGSGTGSSAAAGASGAGVASSAIAYPVYAGTPGLAPDHTIVVTGTGQAEMKSDGSDRSAAQGRAIAAALSDAKAQAQAIASGTGLALGGVLSVSALVSPGYGVVPMAGVPADAPGCVTSSPAGGATAPGTATIPEPACPPIAYPQTLGVSVTVEYAVS